MVHTYERLVVLVLLGFFGLLTYAGMQDESAFDVSNFLTMVVVEERDARRQRK